MYSAGSSANNASWTPFDGCGISLTYTEYVRIQAFHAPRWGVVIFGSVAVKLATMTLPRDASLVWGLHGYAGKAA
ncbi:hypothetical protein EVAR_92361_1 [Eumeta japonica]|uniref:Uncharacterized protein n=1 Tax=Eumeta variegata TaxID=151549 RepID=A0A4C1TIJ5_EUMVA|nr:hypothetical protein EVAR_92361_1 [Eumeta japonica]